MARDEIEASLADSEVVGDTGGRRPPHILFIMMDDVGYNDVSWNNPEVLMPNIDGLARRGVILDQHYAQTVCTPSRAAFLTGMYPFHSGDQHTVLTPGSPTCSARFHRLLPEKLRDAGYKSYAFGKWHMGHCNVSCLPTSRGFDTFSGSLHGIIDHQSLSIMGGASWMEGTTVTKASPGTYSTDVITERVIARIEEHDITKPAFLYVSYVAAHTPIQVPERYKLMYPDTMPDIRRRYLGMITAVDDSVEAIKNKLEERGMWQDTILIFLSDNGGEYVGVPTAGSNMPLRGSKTSLYEGGTRTPAFIYSPDIAKAGSVSQGLFHITDWHHTLLSLAGIESEDPLDGVDQRDMLFKGGKSGRHELVYNIDDVVEFPFYGQAAIRVGDYKLIVGFPGGTDGWEQDGDLSHNVAANYLLPEMPPREDPRPQSHPLGMIDYMKSLDPDYHRDYVTRLRDHVMLFNLREDAEERHNLADVYPEKVKELRERLDELAKQAVPSDPRIRTWDPASSPEHYNGTWGVGWC